MPTLMDLTTWSDAELISLRDKLHARQLQRQAAKWGNRFWKMTAWMGAFALSDGVVGIFFDGVGVLNMIEIALGTIICFSWYRGDKQHKSNIALLDRLNHELANREQVSP